ncbi:MAG TPA: DUF1207 domain-containing protein [Gemmataceae bacterium]|jgi:hypothetical protein|nr:DUF1207 domain-containing protein [Gemmataceae bacterium]
MNRFVDEACRPWAWWAIRPIVVTALALSGWLLADKPAAGQAVATLGAPAAVAAPEHRTFQHAAGVQIDVSCRRAEVTDEDILAALEQAVRQTQARIAQRTQPPVAPDRSPDGFADAGRPEAVPPGAPDGPAAVPVGVTPTVADGLSWRDHAHLTGLPPTLLWEVPLAAQHEPRTYIKPTSLRDATTYSTIDTAIGGEFGLARLSVDGQPDWAIQQDVFAVVFSRWAHQHIGTGIDFRVGFPLTFARGPWEAKIGYEHTSTHLGDDFVEETGRFKKAYVRDEIVMGGAYRCWDQVRLYGQFGYGPYVNTPAGHQPERYDCGVEWSQQRSTGFRGQPFAACDVDLRPEQNFEPNLTAQVGWQWKQLGSRPALRTALEYYDGKSPFGQFFQDREKWLGVGIFLDF